MSNVITLNKIFLDKSMNSLCRMFNTLNLCSNRFILNQNNFIFNNTPCRNIHKTTPIYGLMEFFDDKTNWGEKEVKSGRSWKLDELRIKSNSDLHKLWYILLKERNMLLTMEEECKDKVELFPNPERIDKVKESMQNLETVVRERNKAYHLLETGEKGERSGELVKDQFGLNSYHKHTEHLIPKEINTEWKTKHAFNPRGNAVGKFILHYREKLYNEKRKKRNRDRNHVMGLMKRFPNLDLEAVKAQYPDVDLEKCKVNRKAQGHFISE